MSKFTAYELLTYGGRLIYEKRMTGEESLVTIGDHREDLRDPAGTHAHLVDTWRDIGLAADHHRGKTDLSKTAEQKLREVHRMLQGAAETIEAELE